MTEERQSNQARSYGHHSNDGAQPRRHYWGISERVEVIGNDHSSDEVELSFEERVPSKALGNARSQALVCSYVPSDCAERLQLRQGLLSTEREVLVGDVDGQGERGKEQGDYAKQHVTAANQRTCRAQESMPQWNCGGRRTRSN